MLERASIFASNIGWLALCLPAWVSFQRALKDPEATQRKILHGLLRGNSDCAYGRNFSLAKVRTPREFQDALPVVSYDDLEPWIERMKEGERQVLTSERVLMFEKTTGSSSAAKYVPYTASLRREFQRAIGAWMVDVHLHFPKMFLGQSYWAITPMARQREVTKGGLPVGFESDAEYLGRIEQRLLRRILAVPNSVCRLGSLDECLEATALRLAGARSLTFISVWNPSFLTILMNVIATTAGRGSPVVRQAVTAKHLWPNLQVLSCWTDAEANHALPLLRNLFPDVTIQGKGLLATEGVVSIPLTGRRGCALAVTSHFYEFAEEEDRRPRLAHELDLGGEYSLLLTTGGGLWRYRLGDRVRVTDFVRRTPLLEFVGREESVCDLCGEKLNGVFVGRILRELCPERFAMLAPAQDSPSRYVLFIEGDLPGEAGARLDSRLRRNTHYDYCRRLGQLAAPDIFLVRGGAHEAYLRRCESLGQRAGGVKPTPLHRVRGWEEWFEGEFISKSRPQEIGA